MHQNCLLLVRTNVQNNSYIKLKLKPRKKERKKEEEDEDEEEEMIPEQ